jgi:intraflagellar transport protein 172
MRLGEFTCAAFNTTGETVIVGNFERFYVSNFNAKKNQWDEFCFKQIEYYKCVTSVAWKSDSSKIAIGSDCGSVDIFDVYLKE